MPTKRTRVTRRAQLSQAAIDWIASDDAAVFFDDPDYQHQGYNGPIGRLPGVRPWWPPLHEVWAAHRTNKLSEADRAPLVFLQTLHEEFQRHGR